MEIGKYLDFSTYENASNLPRYSWIDRHFHYKRINAKKNELRIQSKKLATVQKNKLKEIRGIRK